MCEILEQQNKIIISLLSRSTIGIENILKIVYSGKRKENREDYVLAYNALDGTKTGTEIPKIVGITQQGMSSALQKWEEEDIVYKHCKSDCYIGLLKLPKNLKHSSD